MWTELKSRRIWVCSRWARGTWLLPSLTLVPISICVSHRTRPLDVPKGQDGSWWRAQSSAEWHCFEVIVVLLDLSQTLKT